MKSIKLLLFGLFSLFISFAAIAQQNEKREEIEAMKSAFITRRLNLTPDEAKKFWPVYNQYQNELDASRQKRRAEVRSAKLDFDNLSDKELEKVVDGEIIARQTELDILKKYHSQFKQVLTIRKVALLYKSEEEFKRELLKRIREKRDQ